MCCRSWSANKYGLCKYSFIKFFSYCNPMEATLEHSNKGMQHCIEQCLLCYKSCSDTFLYCLNTGGRHVESERIKLLVDCVEICNMASGFMLRNSEFSREMCQLCAEICERCADDCENFEGDVHMKECADVCRKCAESCRGM